MEYLLIVVGVALIGSIASNAYLYRALNKFRDRAKRVKRISTRRVRGDDGQIKPAQRRVKLSPSFDRETSPLASLIKRLDENRLPEQHKIPLILPALDVDLLTYREAQFQNEAASGRPRKKIHLHAEKLAYELTGKSGLVYLNALCISYLRRDTPHTDHAKRLFHRLWKEERDILLNQIPMRWLISTLQTFLDHGENGQQQIIGASGYFYGNMIKLYEGERSLLGNQDQDSYPGNLAARMPESLSDLEGYLACRADIFVNVNTMAFENAMGDPVAGPVLLTLMERVQRAETIFTRIDRTCAKREKQLLPKFNKLFWSFGSDARKISNSPLFEGDDPAIG